MKIIYFTTTICLFSLFSCGQNPIVLKHNTPTNIDTLTAHVEYIIFGIYCGECEGHCATMYQFNSREGSNADTFNEDTTDSYFKNNENVLCQTPIEDWKKIALAQNLYNQIPKLLLITNIPKLVLGCPDCTDGCGIYFEFEQKADLNNETVKKIYIDTDTTKLPAYIKPFTALIKQTIQQSQAKN